MSKSDLLLAAAVTLSITVAAQSNKVQSAWNALKFKELDKAKAAIDLSAEHEDTRNDTKMWYYRGKVYLAINDDKDKFKDLDHDAAEKSFVGFLNCLKTDKSGAYSSEENAAPKLLMAASVNLYNRSKEATYNKDYEKAIRYVNYLPEAFPYDKDKALVRKNITTESLNADLFRLYKASGNNPKAKEYGQKLVDINYKDPNLYLDMSRMMLEEKDTAKALKYIESGRLLREDDMSLIKAEMRIYIDQKKIDVLLEKTSKAIEVAPDNEMLYFVQASIYEQKGDRDKAEASYKKALEVKPDYMEANFNLGALYFNRGVDFNKKANDLPLDQTKKSKEYDDKANESFKLAIPYLEKAHELSPTENAINQTLLKIYKRTGNDEKYNQLKASLEKK